MSEKLLFLYSDFVNRRNYFCHRNHKENDRHNILLNGIYAIYLHHWYKVFDRNQILILNGQDLMENPARIMKQVQNFVGIKEVLTQEDFIFHEDKGFYCIKGDGRESAQCLANTKVCPYQLSPHIKKWRDNY